MASTVNTSVDYNKLESAKKQIDKILTEMMETSSEIGKIINSISALDDAGIDPVTQYGGQSSTNYSAEHGHDGCFNELPSELENLQTSLNDGYLYNQTDKLYKTIQNAIGCFTDSEGKSINEKSWGTFVSGLSSDYKPESIKESENVEWTFHYTEDDFKKNMTEEEKKIFDATNAETARLVVQTEALIYHPDEYESQVEWYDALVQKYLDKGYTEEQAKALAKYERYMEQIDKTGAEKVYGCTSEAWEEKWEAITKEEYPENANSGSDDGTGSGSGEGTGGGSGEVTGGGSGEGTGGGSGDSQIKARVELTEPSTPEKNTPSSGTEEKPSSGTEEKPSNGNENSVISEGEEKVPETPSDEKPSTTPEPDNPSSNNNNNNNNNNANNSGTINNNNNNNNANNSGTINNNNNTSNGGNSNYYSPSNNGNSNYYPPSNNGNSGGSSITGALTEGTTSIEDVIKGSKVTKVPTSPSPVTTTSSSSGSSAVIPIAAGLSAAAAAGIGAKAYMDRKHNNDNGEDNEDENEFNTDEWSGDDSVDIQYDEDTANGENYLDDDDDYSYKATSNNEEKYETRSSEELADLQ